MAVQAHYGPYRLILIGRQDGTDTRGNRPAEHNIGTCYFEGEGVDQDYAKALEWYLKAAEKKNPTSQYMIGWIYQAGFGVTQDIEEAKKWYLMSAEQGYEDAKKALEEIEDGGNGE